MNKKEAGKENFKFYRLKGILATLKEMKDNKDIDQLELRAINDAIKSVRSIYALKKSKQNIRINGGEK